MAGLVSPSALRISTDVSGRISSTRGFSKALRCAGFLSLLQRMPAEQRVLGTTACLSYLVSVPNFGRPLLLDMRAALIIQLPTCSGDQPLQAEPPESRAAWGSLENEHDHNDVRRTKDSVQEKDYG